jgi:hypothetical protein
MDTGCEGGNFISSAFMEEHLSLPSEEIEADPEGERMQLVDFAGKTDFKPLGKVKLKWYGRDIKSGGRRGTRTMQSEDYFRVAPHLSTEDGETPFQILLGKEWLHTHEVLTYRGLRLFKSRERKGLSKFFHPHLCNIIHFSRFLAPTFPSQHHHQNPLRSSSHPAHPISAPLNPYIHPTNLLISKKNRIRPSPPSRAPAPPTAARRS